MAWECSLCGHDFGTDKLSEINECPVCEELRSVKERAKLDIDELKARKSRTRRLARARSGR